jgi:hypothetical protein
MMVNQTEPLVIGLQEAGRLLGGDRQLAKRLIDNGTIPQDKVLRLGRVWKINKRFILSLAGEEPQPQVK